MAVVEFDNVLIDQFIPSNRFFEFSFTATAPSRCSDGHNDIALLNHNHSVVMHHLISHFELSLIAAKNNKLLTIQPVRAPDPYNGTV
jgi:hypothetical protein